jgi:pyridoxal phosphate enzyme (YggS family)
MTTTQTPVQARLEAVRERIARACDRAGRAHDSVTLVAVSKTHSAAAVREAVAAGQRHFGENYVQESVAKIGELSGSEGLVWHFIGPIQSNKTRSIAEHFHWVHTLDRDKIAQRLADQRESANLPPLSVCIEVNVSGEASKSGVTPEDAPRLADNIAAMPRLRLRGLMAIPEPTPDEALARRRFAQLRELRDALNARGHTMDALSMGMSADMDAAIAEGATLVRIGTAIFGDRKK